MPLRDDVSDPWAWLVAGTAAGAAWAVDLGMLAAMGVGAAVFGIKLGGERLLGRSWRRPRGRSLPVRRQSPEERWLRRADKAVAAMQALAESAPEGIVADKCRRVVAQAQETRDHVRRLAGQASAAHAAVDHLDAEMLNSERRRLSGDLDATQDLQLREELSRSLDLVDEQITIHRRMRDSTRALLARLESGVLGLERMVAQLAEILALSDASSSYVEGARRMDELADELEGLRAGLSQTEDLSRRALSAYSPGDSFHKQTWMHERAVLPKFRKKE